MSVPAFHRKEIALSTLAHMPGSAGSRGLPESYPHIACYASVVDGGCPCTNRQQTHLTHVQGTCRQSWLRAQSKAGPDLGSEASKGDEQAKVIIQPLSHLGVPHFDHDRPGLPVDAHDGLVHLRKGARSACRLLDPLNKAKFFQEDCVQQSPDHQSADETRHRT